MILTNIDKIRTKHTCVPVQLADANEHNFMLRVYIMLKRLTFVFLYLAGETVCRNSPKFTEHMFSTNMCQDCCFISIGCLELYFEILHEWSAAKCNAVDFGRTFVEFRAVMVRDCFLFILTFLPICLMHQV